MKIQLIKQLAENLEGDERYTTGCCCCCCCCNCYYRTAAQRPGWAHRAPTISTTARHVPFRPRDAPHPRRAPDARGRCVRESQPLTARRQRARAGYAGPHAPPTAGMAGGAAPSRGGGGQRLHLVREKEAAQRRRGSRACTRQAAPWGPNPQPGERVVPHTLQQAPPLRRHLGGTPAGEPASQQSRREGRLERPEGGTLTAPPHGQSGMGAVRCLPLFLSWEEKREGLLPYVIASRQFYLRIFSRMLFRWGS